MKLFRIFISFCMIAMVLVGNYGVREFIHSCRFEGISSSFFFADEDHCEEEEKTPCCEEEESQNSDCCSGGLNIYQLEFQDYRLNQDDLVLDYDFVIAFENKSFVPNKEIIFSECTPINYYSNPPPNLKLPLFIKNQVFRL